MKRALGRGLGALLPPRTEGREAEAREGDRLLDLPIEAIVPNPHQPRRHFDDEALAELAASIRSSGVLQPVVVRPRGEQWELLVGERRWRAARLAGLATVPAIVRQAGDAEALALAIVENALRENLNPIEEADAFRRLLGDFAWTQEELAGRLGKDRSSIANALRLLKLPAPIQDDLRSGRLTMGHARALLQATSPEAQLALRERILAESWSVRQTERRARRPRVGPPTRRHHPDLASVEDDLRQALGTRVRLVGTAARGRIEVVYSTPDDLMRLHELLTGRAPGAQPIG
jgi:ParB family chromosome partitioning protein